MGAAAAGLLTACGNTASSTPSAPASSAASSEAASAVTKPSSPVDGKYVTKAIDRKSTRLNSSHMSESRMPSSA